MCAVHPDRKSTRLNSSHLVISYAVFCLKKNHQVIFVEDAASAVTPLDAEMIQISNAAGQGVERRGLVQGAVRPVRVAEVLVLAQHDRQVALVPDQGPVQ